MKVTSKYTVAIQIMLCIAHYTLKRKVTSAFLAESTNADATIVRRILGQLQAAGFVTVRPGVGGAYIVKPLSEITLLDIYKAVGAEQDSLFRYYDLKECKCEIGLNLHTVLDPHFHDIQRAMENEMKKVTLEQVHEEMDAVMGAQKF